MNRKGVSVLIGFILLLMIGVTFLTTLQTYYIPSVLKDAEMKHIEKLTSDLVAISGNIFSGKTTSVKFDLGVSYPKYLFLQTPQPMASSIYCENINISVRADLSYPPIGSYNLSEVTGINKTVRIVLNVNNFVLPDYYLIYENSVVFRYIGDINGTPIVVSEQKMFVGNTVNLFLINSSMFQPIATSATVDVVLVPASVSRVYAKDLILTFESIYPEYWNRTLSQQGFIFTNLGDLSNYDRAYNISGNSITIYVKNATLNIYYYFIFNGIGISSSVDHNISYLKPKPWKMIKITYQKINKINITVGQSITLGVKLIDRLLSPIAGAKITVSSSGGHIEPTEIYTDSNGEAYAIFWSNNEGDYNVMFSSLGVNDSIVYNISVFPTATHDIFLNTTIPPDIHILKVYVENLMNQPLNEYQVKIVIDKSILEDIQPDGRDLRVAEAIIDPYNETTGKLPYWIEQKPSTGKLIFWVKLNLSARENKTIFVYWSGRDISSESNGYAVFDFFDDFDTGLNTSKWISYSMLYSVSNSLLTIHMGGIELRNPLPFKFQDGYIAETKVKFNSFWAFGYSGVIPEVASSPYTESKNRNGDATILYMVGSGWNDRLIRYWIGDGSTTSYNIANNKYAEWRASVNVWYVTGVSVYGGTVKLWKDYSVMRVESGISWAKDLKYIKLGSFHRDKLYDIKDTSYDWIRVRKFVEPEPKVTIGEKIQ